MWLATTKLQGFVSVLRIQWAIIHKFGKEVFVDIIGDGMCLVNNLKVFSPSTA